tara:strand:+ start:84 stop:407 length:324 start_codon:yes stop_codon:yes gene_type:complete
MNPQQIADALASGAIPQTLADSLLAQWNAAQVARQAAMDADAKLEQWKQDLIAAPMHLKSKMAKEKAMDANILSAYEEDRFTRREMQNLGRRLSWGSRGPGVAASIF